MLLYKSTVILVLLLDASEGCVMIPIYKVSISIYMICSESRLISNLMTRFAWLKRERVDRPLFYNCPSYLNIRLTKPILLYFYLSFCCLVSCECLLNWFCCWLLDISIYPYTNPSAITMKSVVRTFTFHLLLNSIFKYIHRCEIQDPISFLLKVSRFLL